MDVSKASQKQTITTYKVVCPRATTEAATEQPRFPPRERPVSPSSLESAPRESAVLSNETLDNKDNGPMLQSSVPPWHRRKKVRIIVGLGLLLVLIVAVAGTVIGVSMAGGGDSGQEGKSLEVNPDSNPGMDPGEDDTNNPGTVADDNDPQQRDPDDEEPTQQDPIDDKDEEPTHQEEDDKDGESTHQEEETSCKRGEDKQYDLEVFTLHPVVPPAKTIPLVQNYYECQQQCQQSGYSTASFTYNTDEGDQCLCFDVTSGQCLYRWGDNTKNALRGQLLTTECLDTCELDVCQAKSDYWRCFTGNQITARNVFPHKEGGTEPVKSDVTSSETDCLQFCSSYNAVVFDQYKESCQCFDQVECLLPWGDKVTSPNPYAKIFTKTKLPTCEAEACEVDPKHSYCFFSDWKKDHKQYAMYGDDLKEMASSNQNSDRDCLSFCGPYFAARYNRYAREEDSCICFDNIDCLLVRGDRIATSSDFNGVFYTKAEVSLCDVEFCDKYPSDWHCFTGKESTLIGVLVDLSNNTVTSVANTKVTTEQECLKFCAAYAAVSYEPHGDECECFDDDLQCMMPWGDQVKPPSSRKVAFFTKNDIATCSYDWCDVNPSHWYCFTGQKWQYKDYALYGSNLREVASTDEDQENDCLEFCSPYFAARFARSEKDGDPCVCYEAVDCLVPWGDQVGLTSVPYGSLYTKEDVQVCDFDYCSAFSETWRCFTGQEYAHKEQVLYNAELIASTDATSEMECLKYCSAYQSARYLTNNDGPSCSCFGPAECLLPWGDQVATATIAYGSVFSKDDLATCGFDLCDADPSNYKCFTGQERSLKEVFLYGSNLTLTGNIEVGSEKECLEFCGEYSGVMYKWKYYVFPHDGGGECYCYEGVECMLPWDFDQVDVSDKVAYGRVFTKEDKMTCEFNSCDAFPNSSLCFTNNEVSGYSFSQYGTNMKVEASKQVQVRSDCMEFCGPFDAAKYFSRPKPDGGNNCECYSGVECLLPWGDQVDIYFGLVIPGTLWTKEETGVCRGPGNEELDYCDAFPDSGLCFTAHEEYHREFTLYGEDLVMASSTLVDSEWECLEFCGSFAGVKYFPWISDGSDNCECYDNVDCLLPWGNQVGSYDPKYGRVYTKEKTAECSADFCSLFPQDDLCNNSRRRA